MVYRDIESIEVTMAESQLIPGRKLQVGHAYRLVQSYSDSINMVFLVKRIIRAGQSTPLMWCVTLSPNHLAYIGHWCLYDEDLYEEISEEETAMYYLARDASVES